MNISIRLFTTTILTLAFTCTTAVAQETANVYHDFAYLADSNNFAVSVTDKPETSAYTEAIFRCKNDQNGQTYFAKHLTFPETGISTGKSGSMKVWFEILPDGSVGDMRTVDSPGAEFDAAVTQCLNDMPKWTPAY